MVVVTGGIVLHQTGGVEGFGEQVHAADPFLCLGEILPVITFSGEESPGLVEVHPGEDGGMVEVSFHLCPHTVLPVFPGFRHRLAPEVRGVGHYQQSEPVGPVEFAGHFHLDVDPIAVEAKSL